MIIPYKSPFLRCLLRISSLCVSTNLACEKSYFSHYPPCFPEENASSLASRGFSSLFFTLFPIKKVNAPSQEHLLFSFVFLFSFHRYLLFYTSTLLKTSSSSTSFFAASRYFSSCRYVWRNGFTDGAISIALIKSSRFISNVAA